MATFFGAPPGGNLEYSREEMVASMQDNQAAVIAFTQMQSEMKNMQMQMETLNGNMEELKSRSRVGAKENNSKKLPKRLLVSFINTLCEAVNEYLYI